MWMRAPADDDEKRERIEALYARSRRQFPEVPEMTVDELQARRDDEELVLVDVRQPQERAVSMIPGAIASEELEADPERFRDRKLVTYCTIGHRSGLYARRLQAAGFKVHNLKGSILAWTHTGEPLAGDGGETRSVHVGGPNWSLEAEGFDPVW